MNVLLANQGIAQDGMHAAITRIVDEIAQYLKSKGHAVTLVTRKLSPGQENYEFSDGMHIYRYRSVFPQSKLFFLYPVLTLARAGRVLRKAIRERQIDVINYHDPFHAASGREFGNAVPSVLTFHSPLHKEYAIDARGWRLGILRQPMTAFFKAIDYRALSSASAIVTLSQFMAMEAKQVLGNHQVPFYEIPGGVDIERFNDVYDRPAIRSELALPKDAFVFFTARRLVGRMGLENLIRAFAIVRQRFDDVLLIAGHGWMHEKLSALIRELGLSEKCRLLGFVPEEKLPLYYQAADVFVLPTAELEGFGIVILEAFATDTPVIGTPVGSIPEVLQHFDSNLLTRSSSSEDIAAKMISIREQLSQSKLRRNYADIVRHQFTNKQFAEQYERLFTTLLSRQRTTA